MPRRALWLGGPPAKIARARHGGGDSQAGRGAAASCPEGGETRARPHRARGHQRHHGALRGPPGDPPAGRRGGRRAGRDGRLLALHPRSTRTAPHAVGDRRPRSELDRQGDDERRGGAHRHGDREARAGDGGRCDHPSPLQVLPGDRRGEVPLLPRRADHRARYADRRAGRADAPAPQILPARDPHPARDRLQGRPHHRDGAPDGGPEEQGERAARGSPPDGGIIDAHRLMLEDPGFARKLEAAIHDGLAAEAALKRVVEEYVEQFVRMSDGYLRDRAVDVKDVGLRILRNLLGVAEPERPLAKDSVLVADELTLSDLALIEHEHLCGIVLATGGVTSHASILAKSFEIPTVVGCEHLIETVQEGDDLIVDGNSGVVYVNPPVDVAREYERLERDYSAFNQKLETLKLLPAETSDGRRLSLYANIGLIADLLLAHRHGAQGVGLYRTEFPFLTYREFPDEEEQYDLYARVVRGMEGKPVTIRTLDVGADKYPAYMQVPREDNPYLGWRSIRISLEMPEFFKVQLRAILRAAALGRVRIMFPMISSVEEIRRAKDLLEEAKEELASEGREHDPGVQVGMMVEVPSAVALANQLIREVDFFSIGTNDLIQYLLAVDRSNRKVAPLYEPLHPAVLSAVHDVVQAAKGAGKWVGMCGEMASEPLCTLVLLGFGLDDVSMGPFFIPVIKRIIRSVSYAAARNIARDVLEMATIKEGKGYLFDGMKGLGIIELMEMYH